MRGSPDFYRGALTQQTENPVWLRFQPQYFGMNETRLSRVYKGARLFCTKPSSPPHFPRMRPLLPRWTRDQSTLQPIYKRSPKLLSEHFFTSLLNLKDFLRCFFKMLGSSRQRM